MKKNIIVSILALLIIIIGCSSGTDNPVAAPEPAIRQTDESSHLLWGMWQFVADPEAQTLEFVPLRISGMHLNALPFLEPPALVNLTLESLEFNGNIIEADIGLRHPFLGLTEFTGFDVCGVLIANGSVNGFTNPDLVMADSDDTRLLNTDGLTRWWNPAEFPNNGTIFGYIDGMLGAPDSFADYNSTLNGYKFFCDDITDPGASVSTIDPLSRCVFSAGQKNVRHYTIELGSEGLIFNYAIDASWQFPDGDPPWEAPGDFAEEANRPEAWNISVNETENSLWNDGTDNGGSLSLSIDLWDHFNAEQNIVYAESPGNFDPIGPLSPTGGGEGYSTYTIEISDAGPGEDSIGVLIIAECEVVGYGATLTDEPVTAYFIHIASVSDEPPSEPADPIEGNVELQVLRDMAYAITGLRLNWTGNANPEYAVYADLNPYDGITPDTYIDATAAETIDIDTTNYPAFSTNACYTFTVRARSQAGSALSESTDSQYAFVEMEDFDGGADPSGGWEYFYRNSDTQFVIEAGPINGNVLRQGPTPSARWTVAMMPDMLPVIADSEYSVIEVAQKTVYWQSKPWSEQIDGMYSQTTVGWMDGVPTNGNNQCLELHTPPLDAAIDGTWDLEDQLNPTTYLTSLHEYFAGGSGLWHGWRIFYLDRSTLLPTRFSRVSIPEYRTETDVYAGYGYAIHPTHSCPDEVYADEFAVIVY